MNQVSTKRQVTKEVVLNILLNGVAPLVVYSILSGQMSDVAALSIAATIPAIDNLISFLRYRRLDVFGAFMLAGLVVGIGVLLLGGDPKLLLVRESFVTAAFGLVMLGSLLLPRPIIFYFAIHFSGGKDEATKAEFAQKWALPYFRFVMYLMTIVWGVALVAEAVIRTILVFALNNTSEFLAVSPFIQYGILGATIAWTVWYGKHAKKVGEAMRQERINQEAQKVQEASFAR